MIHEKIKNLNLPDILTAENGKQVEAIDWENRRTELVDIMCREVYGYVPGFTGVVRAECVETKENACAGKAVFEKLNLTVEWDGNSFSFPLYLTLPKAVENPRVIVTIAFEDDIPSRYYPQEEVVDQGMGVALFCYKDVSSDDGDFTNGVAPLLTKGVREATTLGKIGMWSWAASRVMDYLETLEHIDHKNIAVLGHSRLGKTALLTGALDKRFNFVFANESGCTGASITREKQGERVRQICDMFWFWFCENYKKYIDKEHEMPFDQHFLLAAIAPRYICVGGAEADIWADPEAEFYSCVAASVAYELLGEKGFVHQERLAKPCEKFFDGGIGLHYRTGTHFLSRHDWMRYIEYMNEHRI